MSQMKNFEQAPTEELDVQFEWAARLSTSPVETISSSIWAVDAPMSVMSGAGKDSSISGTVTTVWLTGGVTGASYELTNTIVTSAGRKLVRTRLVDVTDR